MTKIVLMKDMPWASLHSSCAEGLQGSNSIAVRIIELLLQDCLRFARAQRIPGFSHETLCAGRWMQVSRLGLIDPFQTGLPSS